MLGLRQAHQSWGGTVKQLEPTRYDYLFALVADRRCWLIPSDEVDGRSCVRPGGPEYARFEVDDQRGVAPSPPLESLL